MKTNTAENNPPESTDRALHHEQVLQQAATTARNALVEGFIPLNKKPGYFTALVAIRHVHILGLDEALKVLAGVLGRESLTVWQVSALDAAHRKALVEYNDIKARWEAAGKHLAQFAEGPIKAGLRRRHAKLAEQLESARQALQETEPTR